MFLILILIWIKKIHDACNKERWLKICNIRKVRYPLPELYVKPVWIYFGGGGREVHETS
jgi:hypothetical protein